MILDLFSTKGITIDTKKSTVDTRSTVDFSWLGNVLLSQDPSVQVPSALEGLTVVFGMGTRGTPLPLSPNLFCSRYIP